VPPHHPDLQGLAAMQLCERVELVRKNVQQAAELRWRASEILL
jgi:hypothetical protein